MEDARDIAALSLPFTAGVALAAAGRSAGVFAGPGAGAAAGTALAAAAGLIAYAAGRRRTGLPPYIILFFCLGIFCFISSGLLPGGAAPGPVGRLAARALAGLRRIIGAVPFAHGSSHALAGALLTGDRSGLTAEQTAAFRDSGASHILALSGLHIGIIYLIVSRLLSLLGNSPGMRRARSITVILLSAFYTIVTGAGPSIVRAFLFILLHEICSMSPERKSSPVRILLIALTLQLAFNPEAITSLGFQLSYLAMTGILILHPRLEAWFPSGEGRFHPVRAIWKSASLAISCQIFTAPLVWIRFHTFPKYFIITNLLALPLTTAVMAGSVAAVALQGLGGCPTFLASLTDTLIQTLLFILHVISSL